MTTKRSASACLGLALILATGIFSSACDVIPGVPLPAGTGAVSTCNDAIAAVWPPELQGRARRIAWRESHNRPTAQNRRSSAAGCFQLLSLHARRFTKLGYTWSDRYDAGANVTVAYDLYREQGWSPWR